VYRPKHVEWTCREINSLHIVASVGHSIECIEHLVRTDYERVVTKKSRVNLREEEWEDLD